MARINVERAHNLGLEAAREKAQPLVEKLAGQYGLTPTWQGDTVKLKRSGVNGTLEIGEKTVKVDVELGMLMSAMSGMIQSEIERSLDKVLARAWHLPSGQPATYRRAMSTLWHRLQCSLRVAWEF